MSKMTGIKMSGVIEKKYILAIIVTIALTIFFAWIFTSTDEISNNVTLVVEVGIGIIITTIIYAFSRKSGRIIEQKINQTMIMVKDQHQYSKTPKHTKQYTLSTILEHIKKSISNIQDGIEDYNGLNHPTQKDKDHIILQCKDLQNYMQANITSYIQLSENPNDTSFENLTKILKLYPWTPIFNDDQKIVNGSNYLRLLEFLPSDLPEKITAESKITLQPQKETTITTSHMQVSCDRSVYPLDSIIHVQANLDSVIKGDLIIFEILDSNRKLLLSKELDPAICDVSNMEHGVFQIDFKMIGDRWHAQNNYIVRATHGIFYSEDMFAIHRRVPVIQSDKSVYNVGDGMIITVIDPDADKDSERTEHVGDRQESKLIIESPRGRIDGCQLMETGASTGIFQRVVGIAGRQKDVTATKNIFDEKHVEKIPGTEINNLFIECHPGQEIAILYTNKTYTVSLSVLVAGFGATIDLDQKVYSWNDRVYITVMAPDLSINKNKPNVIGVDSDARITIATSKDKIDNYMLMETGKDTGIFTGEITLIGSKGNTGDSSTADKIPDSYSDHTDGLIACDGADELSVMLSTKNGTVQTLAQIRLNIGEMQWLEPGYPVYDAGIVRVTDPDMNINPDVNDKFKIRVWSDSDPEGIEITVMETGPSTGIFDGTVYFSDASSDSSLHVRNGDTVTAEYPDATLPPPYLPTDKVSIICTTVIGTSFVAPLGKVIVKNIKILDEENNPTDSFNVKQLLKISVDLVNTRIKSQPFVLSAKIRKSNTYTIIASPVVTGVLAKQKSALIQIPWIPQGSGTFVIHLAVWDITDNPFLLAKRAKTQVDIRPVKHLVSIPTGTGVPGCEKNHQCFIPHQLHIKPKQTVLWSNDDDDDIAHTIISENISDDDLEDQFNSGLIMSGESFSHYFKHKGICRYFCVVHPWQTGTIVVED